MNTEQKLNIINNITTPTIVNITTLTDVKMNKKNRVTKELNPFVGKVYKLQTTKVEINSDYESKVNEVLTSEGKEANFESGSLKWGECLDNKIVTKNDVKYLKVIELEKLNKPSYITLNDDNTISDEIEYEKIVDYLPPKQSNTKQQLDTEVNVRIYKLDSIVDININ